MKKLLPLLIIFTLSVFHLIAQTTVTLQPANGTGKDANIASFTPTANFGIHEDFEGVTWTCGGNLCLGRSLVEFDLSFIPAGSTINSATLNLFANLNNVNGISGQPTYGS